MDDKSGKKLLTPDAIHLATAIIHKADFFLTLDNKLLNLNGDGRMEGLAIGKPELAFKGRQPEMI